MILLNSFCLKILAITHTQFIIILNWYLIIILKFSRHKIKFVKIYKETWQMIIIIAVCRLTLNNVIIITWKLVLNIKWKLCLFLDLLPLGSSIRFLLTMYLHFQQMMCLQPYLHQTSVVFSCCLRQLYGLIVYSISL